jgi:hypothetical protein
MTSYVVYNNAQMYWSRFAFLFFILIYINLLMLPWLLLRQNSLIPNTVKLVQSDTCVFRHPVTSDKNLCKSWPIHLCIVVYYIWRHIQEIFINLYGTLFFAYPVRSLNKNTIADSNERPSVYEVRIWSKSISVN